MNLIEALKQIKPISRPGYLNGVWVDPKYLLDVLSKGDLRPWSQEDLLADDWIVKEETFEVTEKELREILRQWWRGDYTRDMPMEDHVIDKLKERKVSHRP